ncbi:MAG: FGGY family carbohydrate kinase, partial [Chloroflexota bacterium]
MGTALLLGVDVGGTAVKVVAFDAAGSVRGAYTEAIPVDTPRPGWAEIAPQRWYAAVAAGVRAALAQAGAAPEDVAALGLSNMIGTLAPLDAQGRPLRPAIAYYDTRSAAQAAWMLQRAPEITTITANRVTSGNTGLATILWLREHEPEVYRQAALFAQTGTLLFRWLTGESRVDWTNASFMGLYDYRSRCWSAKLADAFNVDLDRLAPVAAPHSAAGLMPSAAEALGLRPGTPVALGGLDGAMASLGVGAIHPGEAYAVSGTSEMVAVCLPRPVAAPELLARWHVVPEVWTLIGAISTAGAAWDWLARTVYGVEPSQEAYARMTSEAEASPLGANGVLFLPHLMGERAPLWDPHARGVFFGLSLGTTRADLARAVLEGAAYAMRHNLELIAGYGGLAVRRVVAVGGGARNALWRQIKADVWGVELAVSPVREAAALGAALTAGVATGVYANYAQAVERAVAAPTELAAPGQVTRPEPEHRAAYDGAYGLYRTLYPAL